LIKRPIQYTFKLRAKPPLALLTRFFSILLCRRSKVLIGNSFFYLFTFSFSLFILTFPVSAKIPVVNINLPSLTLVSSKTDLLEEGKTLYQAGRFAEAVRVLQAADTFDNLQKVVVLSNLSLAYQQLGQWKAAEDNLSKAIALLEAQSNVSSRQHSQLLAQVLDVQGRLQFAQGKMEVAIATWKQAANIYKSLNDHAALNRNKINSVEALQALGLFHQSKKILAEVEQSLKNQQNLSLKTKQLRSLGNILQVVGNLDESRSVLEQSLLLAKGLSSKQDISESLLSLGNTLRAQGDMKAAQNYYEQAIATSVDSTERIVTQLNQLSLLIETKQYRLALALSSQIEPEINKLPPNRNTIYAKINFAKSLMMSENTSINILQLLVSAVQQARTLQDKRAESYALGTLANLYEPQQISHAQNLTQKALFIAETINAPDITYQWQWQMGRILKKSGNITAAIPYYRAALKILQSNRSDIVTANSDIQFSFRENVEPVYRGLVALLLQSYQGNNQANLIEARAVIELLQIAELDNFFRSACLVPKQEIDALINRTEQNAAIIYPIILPESINVILKLPSQELRYYSTPISQAQVENTTLELTKYLTDVTQTLQVKQQSQQIYDWLIKPIQPDLDKNKIKTLVFVLDGELRNVPMGVLYDKQQQKYLMEKYAIALTPSLQLLDPVPLHKVPLKALTAGLTQERLIENRVFPPLQNVQRELQQIQSEIPKTATLFNQYFTQTNLRRQLQSAPYTVVHLATHGEFSSDSAKTFILTWDKLLKVKEFDVLVKTQDQKQPDTIELLVLSACKTAQGDKRAALGLAGVAIKAGARSTLATLWSIDDQSTADLMSEFYRQLKAGVSKAEALQRTQLSMFAKEKRPYFWAPFVLVGNWL
jgi:CHAT domain-containing protein